MAALNTVSTDNLRQVVAKVDGMKPTQRWLALMTPDQLTQPVKEQFVEEPPIEL